MRTLLGLFMTRADGLLAMERLRTAGLPVELIDQPPQAGESSRDASSGHNQDSPKAAGSVAAVGALAGGLLGAVPGALVGALVSKGLTEMNASRYERAVADGGVVLVVTAEELQPAAQAEDILRASGAIHVHTGETPRAS